MLSSDECDGSMAAGLMKIDTGGMYTEGIEGLMPASAETELIISGPYLCTVVICLFRLSALANIP
jgi:hypothetical protein